MATIFSGGFLWLISAASFTKYQGRRESTTFQNEYEADRTDYTGWAYVRGTEFK